MKGFMIFLCCFSCFKILFMDSWHYYLCSSVHWVTYYVFSDGFYVFFLNVYVVCLVWGFQFYLSVLTYFCRYFWCQRSLVLLLFILCVLRTQLSIFWSVLWWFMPFVNFLWLSLILILCPFLFFKIFSGGFFVLFFNSFSFACNSALFPLLKMVHVYY